MIEERERERERKKESRMCKGKKTIGRTYSHDTGKKQRHQHGRHFFVLCSSHYSIHWSIFA